jgi:hypothetical protein
MIRDARQDGRLPRDRAALRPVPRPAAGPPDAGPRAEVPRAPPARGGPHPRGPPVRRPRRPRRRRGARGHPRGRPAPAPPRGLAGTPGARAPEARLDLGRGQARRPGARPLAPGTRQWRSVPRGAGAAGSRAATPTGGHMAAGRAAFTRPRALAAPFRVRAVPDAEDWPASLGASGGSSTTTGATWPCSPPGRRARPRHRASRRLPRRRPDADPGLAHPPAPEVQPQGERAVLGGSGVRCCPAPGCGWPLTGHQRAGSARCRAALSRRRRTEAGAARDRELRRLLVTIQVNVEAALRLLDGGRFS